MGQIEVFSPAKINLFLAVLGRLETGFHELASLVAQLDFGDRLKIAVEDATEASVELRCSDVSLPTDRSNLAYAAAEGFLLRSGLNWKVQIDLDKEIPHGAGLGGGSSNASAVLLGLSELAEQSGALGVSRGERLELAAELGSDCPLFLSQKPVVMRGRGELISPLGESAIKGLAGREVLLFKPSFSIGTGWAYGELARRGDYDDRAWAEERLAAWTSGNLELGELLFNRFELTAFEKYVGMDTLFSVLKELGIRCLMSGSGSCCFALLEGEEQADLASEKIRDAWGNRVFLKRAHVLG